MKMEILQNASTKIKQQSNLGGNRAVIFVYAMTVLDTIAFMSNGVSLFTYFNDYMNFSLTKSSVTHTNFMGTAFLLPLLGGFISDTYYSRFKTCVIFGCLEVVGYGLLAVQAHFKHLRPYPWKDVTPSASSQCESATTGQEAILFVGLYLVALGTGGVKAALPALGADQFDENDPEEAVSLSSFFNWYMFSITLGGILSMTFLVWISANLGWDWAFGICAVAVALAVMILSMGCSTYRTNVPKGSPLVRILQVLIAAIRNRKLPLPGTTQELHEIQDKEAGNYEVLQRTDQFKFLDHAAIVTRQTNEVATVTQGTWTMCTVTQVEETKILVRMLPIILSTVFMNTCLAQFQTFSIQQSNTMDRKIGSFEMPGSSIPVIPLVFMIILIPIYDRVFVPLARKLTGIATGITQLQRIAVGLVLSILSMTVSGFVEMLRKNVAIKHGMVDSTYPLPISVFWLGIQYVIFGLADMFSIVGMMEFFYAESSSGMKSIGTAISCFSLSLGFYSSTVVVNIVNRVSKGWLASNNLNRDKLEYFYWLLALISVANFGAYVMCACWYKQWRIQEQISAGSHLTIYFSWITFTYIFLFIKIFMKNKT